MFTALTRVVHRQEAACVFHFASSCSSDQYFCLKGQKRVLPFAGRLFVDGADLGLTLLKFRYNHSVSVVVVLTCLLTTQRSYFSALSAEVSYL